MRILLNIGLKSFNLQNRKIIWVISLWPYHPECAHSCLNHIGRHLLWNNSKWNNVAYVTGTDEWSTINFTYLTNLNLLLTLYSVPVSWAVSLPAKLNNNLHAALSGLSVLVIIKSWKLWNSHRAYLENKRKQIPEVSYYSMSWPEISEKGWAARVTADGCREQHQSRYCLHKLEDRFSVYTELSEWMLKGRTYFCFEYIITTVRKRVCMYIQQCVYI